MNFECNIFDADRHVTEPFSIWKDYVDPAAHKKYPISIDCGSYSSANKIAKKYGESDIRLPVKLKCAEMELFSNVSEQLENELAKKAAIHKEHVEASKTCQGQLKALRSAGFARASLFPTIAPQIINHENIPAEIATEYAQGYNRWLRDYCSNGCEKLIGVALVNRKEPHTMVSQLERLINLGYRTVTLRPEIIEGRTLGHTDYFDFWAQCESTGVSVALHGGTHLAGSTAGTDRFSSRFALHACSHVIEMQMAFLSLLEVGVFERYPNLKIAFIEAGSAWIIHWLWRLDNICYPEFPSLVKKNIKILPSEYFRRQCWVTVEPGESCLKQVIDTIGCNRLMFGSDFPHLEHIGHFHSESEGVTAELSDVSERERKAILEDNAIKFYNC